MIKETMTAEERVRAAIELRPVDRVPVIPLSPIYFACRQKGMSMAEMARDLDRARQANVEVCLEMGKYDGMAYPGLSNAFAPRLSAIIAMPTFLRPGAEIADDLPLQYAERQILGVEDYRLIADMGWRRYAEKHYQKFSPYTPEQIVAWGQRNTDITRKDVDAFKSIGVTCYLGPSIFSPLMFFSIFRTLVQFTLDLHRHPDLVQAAMDAIVDDFIQDGIDAAKEVGLPWIMLVLERGGIFYYPLRIFERFEWPYLKKMAETWIANGFVPLLHFDQDWTDNMPYLKDLPRGKCIVDLDSCTDIFKAKEQLRNHLCIMGDVRATMLSLGTPEEVEEYCRKLIDTVGKDNGFILSSGCMVPLDAKYENVRAMVNTAKTYYPHRS